MPLRLSLPQRSSPGLLLTTVLLGLVACSPALDWREWRPQGSGIQLLMPCKPVPQMRKLRLAGQAVNLWLHACQAGAQTWGLAYADMGDPSLVGPALAEFRASAATNIAGAEGSAAPWVVPGATPHVESRRVQLQGRLPDGKAVHEQVATFSMGTTVFQATVIGEVLPADAVDNFFGSIRASP